jgi:hypothetical protein
MEWYMIVVLTAFGAFYLGNVVFRHIVNQIIMAVLKGLLWVFSKVDSIGRGKTAVIKTAKLSKVTKEPKFEREESLTNEINDAVETGVIDTSEMTDKELHELQEYLKGRKIESAR